MEDDEVQQGIVFYADIWGFTYLSNSKINEAWMAIDCVYSELQRIKKMQSLHFKTYALSDSIFIACPFTRDKRENGALLDKLLLSVEELFDSAREKDILLRGAGCFGNFKFSENRLVGEAVNKSVYMEKELELLLPFIPFVELIKAIKCGSLEECDKERLRFQVDIQARSGIWNGYLCYSDRSSLTNLQLKLRQRYEIFTQSDVPSPREASVVLRTIQVIESAYNQIKEQ